MVLLESFFMVGLAAIAVYVSFMKVSAGPDMPLPVIRPNPRDKMD